MINTITLRANVATRTFGKKLIIIYDDHRWLLNVLFKLYKESNGATYNIVTFDAINSNDCTITNASTTTGAPSQVRMTQLKIVYAE